jgi:RNA polymerase sigma factor (sigma-70 family)
MEPSGLGESLAVLAQVVTAVARRGRLSPDDAQDFGQSVYLKLVETDFAVLRQFAARSSLKTYLTTVVARLLVDWRRAAFGKWRSSTIAVRRGRAAVALERLVHRDGLAVDEAIEVLRCAPGAPSAAELRRIAGDLPTRIPHRRVSDACLEEIGTFTDPVDEEERTRTARQISQALTKALRRLPFDDRRLLRLRYKSRRRVSTLASELGVDAKTLYRRCDRALRILRRSLEADGVVSSSTAVQSRTSVGEYL